MYSAVSRVGPKSKGARSAPPNLPDLSVSGKLMALPINLEKLTAVITPHFWAFSHVWDFIILLT